MRVTHIFSRAGESRQARVKRFSMGSVDNCIAFMRIVIPRLCAKWHGFILHVRDAMTARIWLAKIRVDPRFLRGCTEMTAREPPRRCSPCHPHPAIPAENLRHSREGRESTPRHSEIVGANCVRPLMDSRLRWRSRANAVRPYILSLPGTYLNLRHSCKGGNPHPVIPKS